MYTRRQFIQTTVAAVGATALPACSSPAGTGSSHGYGEAVERTWRHSEGPLTTARALRRELVRYATLAPSSHNTQCWKFTLEEGRISILPDLLRRCPVVDPDNHHLFVSLGCAAENLVQAAQANGLHGEVRFDGAGGDVVRVAMEPTKPVSSPMFQAIPKRQCTRAPYDEHELPSEQLKLLERAAKGDGVDLLLLTDRDRMEEVLEYVVQGNTIQMNDRAFVEELETWIRFSEGEAVRRGDGLFSRSFGNPAVPRWLASPLMSFFFRAGSENEKYARHIRSSAGIAVFVSEADEKPHWVEAGRCYERFALQAAALGIRNALVNQPVEVAALRPQFASHLGVGNRRPDLIVRFGHGPEMPPSLRRPIDAVIV